MTSRHAIDPEVIRGLDSIAAETARVKTTAAVGHATLATIKAAEAAANRLQQAARTLVNATRRSRAEAEQAERIERREAEKAERRNDQIRRERGLPCGASDLAIPNF